MVGFCLQKFFRRTEASLFFLLNQIIFGLFGLLLSDRKLLFRCQAEHLVKQHDHIFGVASVAVVQNDEVLLVFRWLRVTR